MRVTTAGRPPCVWCVVPCCALRATAARRRWTTRPWGPPPPTPTRAGPAQASSSGQYILYCDLGVTSRCAPYSPEFIETHTKKRKQFKICDYLSSLLICLMYKVQNKFEFCWLFILCKIIIKARCN